MLSSHSNLALSLYRDTHDSGDIWWSTSEGLYALHRLWNEYQSPRMGTSPIDAHDAGDKCQTYDYIAPALHALPAEDAAHMIKHATRVLLRLNDYATSQGMDY